MASIFNIISVLKLVFFPKVNIFSSYFFKVKLAS